MGPVLWLIVASQDKKITMRILFISATRIGDAVLSTGLLSYLLDRYPDAKVTVACGAPAAAIFKSVPNLERIIILEKKPYGGHWLSLWSQVAGKRWGRVVDLRRSALGYLVLSKRSYIAPKTNPSLHRVEDLGRTLKLNPPPAPKLWIGEHDQKSARALVPDLGKKPLLCIGPTANWGGKMWPADRFVELARRLTGATGPLPGATIAIFGAAHERHQAQPVINGLTGLPVIDLVGKPDLLTCAAIFSAASLYVGNDSGLMHIAAASGGNVLGLFGPSPAKHYAPWPSGGGKVSFVQTDQSYEELVFSDSFDYTSQNTLMGGLSVDKAEYAARQLLQRVQLEQAA